MTGRDGPLVELRCTGCAHCRSERYRVQGDSGSNIYCYHPESGGKFVGDTDWRTPVWCPLRKQALLAAARAAGLEVP